VAAWQMSEEVSNNVVWPKVREFIAGTTSGWGLVVAGHPFDTIKVRLQSEGVHGRFQGPIHCLLDTFRNEGVIGLYKGALGPLLTQGMVNAWEFGIYGIALSALKDNSIENNRGTLGQQWVAGAIAGIATFVVATPQEAIKVRVQSQYTKNYDGTFAIARQVWKNEGLAGFFVGAGATVLSRFFFANYIVAYETSRKVLTSDGATLSPGATLIAGGCAGTAYWLSNYPFDVIKNKMQAAIHTGKRYSSMTACAKEIYHVDGWKGFTRGLSVCLMRALPANATCFLFLEITRKILPVSL
jgi:solute carrier family 25 (mitochondrial carnitine/acylcarnitine transporter), member 20/29